MLAEDVVCVCVLAGNMLVECGLAEGVAELKAWRGGVVDQMNLTPVYQ